jgi:acyl-CoA synthetase (AMP-forming)/AMP-acid ligase II
VAVAFGLLLEFPIRRGQKILLLQPLSHGAGFFMLPYYISGCQCVILPKFDPAATLEIAAEQSIETIKLVPTMLGQLLQMAPNSRDVPALRRIIYGAAPMPSNWLLEGLQRFGPVFAQLYGQAESPMCITVLPEADHDLDRPELLSSAGRPWLSADVRVVGLDGKEVRSGETGEVVVRAATTMSGYWNLPEETAEVFVDGRLHTRDLATVDERGYVYLLGRRDDMINSGGFMIAPRTVEEVLHQHSGILEAAVIGIPDPVWGEAVKAVVVLRPGVKVTAEDVIAFCRDRLGFQRPRYVDIRTALPKNAYGKVLKTMLREQEGS